VKGDVPVGVRGSGYIDPPFDLGTSWRWNFKPLSLYLRGKNLLAAIGEEIGWTPEQVCTICRSEILGPTSTRVLEVA
jgi:hypothetical protein